MIYLTLAEAAFMLNLNYEGPDLAFQGISTDTRTIQPGNLFIALEGEHFDGHLFLEEAARKGASAAMISKKLPCPIPTLRVKDTVAALGQLATCWRERFNIILIALTGSHGKTTTKNLIQQILLANYDWAPHAVLASQGSFNNHIGVPLTLLQLTALHKMAVIEMGMNHLGEIDYLTRLCEPDVALITNVGAAHLENLGSEDNVAKAKSEIFTGLHHNGTAILNRDDRYFTHFESQVPHNKILKFGLSDLADVTATDIKQFAAHSEFTIKTPLGEAEIKLSLPGKHNILNALAATAAAIATENVTLNAIKQGLEKAEPVKGRSVTHHHPSGATIIDDTYNAVGIKAIQAAADMLAQYPEPRIAVFGEMRELGQHDRLVHHQVGELFKALGVSRLYTYGAQTEATIQAFGDNAKRYDNKDDLIQDLISELKPHATILVKGSRSTQMESIVEALLEKNN